MLCPKAPPEALAELENDPVKKCIEDVLDGLAETGEFSEEVVNQARDKLSTFEDCDSPIKCIFGLSRSMAQSTITDAPNFSKALNKGLATCSNAFPACNLFIRRVSVCSKLTTPLPTEAPPSTETTQVPIFDPYNKVKECVGNVVEAVIKSGNFTKEALGGVTDGTFVMCDSIKCLTNEVRFLQEHAISGEARELAKVLDQKIIPEYLTNPNQCFTYLLERIPPTKDFSEDATNLARGLLLNPACGSPDKCFPEFKESIKMSCIQDAPKLAEYLQGEFVPCFEFLQRTAV
ncbi:unnamed protein product [Caenorhabditis nigoni]